MTIIESVHAVLNPLAAGGSWYQVNTAQPPVLPYIVFSRVPSTINYSLKGPSDLQNTRFQVDLYTRTVAELVSIGTALEAAMAAALFTNVLLSARDIYETDTKLHRSCFEYSAWSTS